MISHHSAHIDIGQRGKSKQQHQVEVRTVVYITVVILWSVLYSGVFHYCRLYKLITCCIVKISQDVSLLNSNSSEVCSLLICAVVKHSACYHWCLSFSWCFKVHVYSKWGYSLQSRITLLLCVLVLERAVCDRAQSTGFKVSPTMYWNKLNCFNARVCVRVCLCVWI